MIRTFEQDIVERFAANSRVPIINGLTNEYHPCQILADIYTFIEHRGSIQGKTVAWVGDGNNMCNSYIEAAIQFDFQLRIACPEGYDPSAELVAKAGSRVTIVRDPKQAVAGAHLVSTDVWTSMGQEEETAKRLKLFAPLQVNRALLDLAVDRRAREALRPPPRPLRSAAQPSAPAPPSASPPSRRRGWRGPASARGR